VNNASVEETMNRLRLYIEGMAIPLDDNDSISLTVSIGVTSTLCNTLGEMINRADEALYKAKQHGRNQVVMV